MWRFCASVGAATLCPSLLSMYDTVGVVENSFKEMLFFIENTDLLFCLLTCSFYFQLKRWMTEIRVYLCLLLLLLLFEYV